MPKKKIKKRTFSEWFFGTKATNAPKKTQKNTTQEAHHSPAPTKSLHSHIDDALDGLSDAMAKRLASADTEDQDDREYLRIELLKRKHLRIGVVAFMTLIVVVWGWSAIASVGYFGTLSRNSFDNFKDLAGSISEGASQTFAE